ncbi:alkene reductase [Amycolatopsis cynarae]|uniref:Alkene reductase n=1 Tax=Amycolatopsis cynarae TaxID=2995223 RepID=A0ABY7BDW5_9PSEU|nr:alkene reductase [Amycolatopsis sp. HUAS 11-8]WAL68813.1 alkene reductase [Amycolatopsis sp. HUAS 11-8]
MSTLWTPFKLGRIELEHRLAMAPMTRSRALPEGTPSPLAPEYYAQRASLGLLISEGTQPSEDGQGYLATPGIHTDAQMTGWRKVTDAVHDAGGHLFIQLMHTGRISHPDNTPHGRQAVAPSAIAPEAPMFTLSGMQDIPRPRALGIDEIAATVDDFRTAAARAIEAGADGVEIHGANGYLIQQFLAPNANTRTDAYGGSVEGRIRFAVEVAQAVAEEIGPERTGFRISPGSTLNGIDEGPERAATYHALITELAKLDLVYLHVMQGTDEALLHEIRALWPTALLVNRIDRRREELAGDLDAGIADIVPLGRWALANPDLVQRLQEGAPLNEADPATFYGGGNEGYTDYPVLIRR